MLYIPVDVGCVECGEKTALYGVFSSMGKAKAELAKHTPRRPHIFKVEYINAPTQAEFDPELWRYDEEYEPIRKGG